MADNRLFDWLRERLAARLAEVLESMSGAAVRVTPGPDPAPALESADPLIWRQPFDLAPTQPLWMSAGQGAWHEIGEQSLIAVGVDNPDEESVRGTYLEIISQAWSSLGRDLGERMERQVSPVDGAEGDSWPSQHSNFLLEIQFPGRAPVSLRAGVPAAFLSALEVQPAAPAAPPAAAMSIAGPPSADTRPSRTLDLLLDVEMPVSVSFGRLMVPLKDVLKLTSGSVIELNRTVSEPVEIIVNNCVIARGDVVVIEGNYGVRIQNIVNSQERLRTLS